MLRRYLYEAISTSRLHTFDRDRHDVDAVEHPRVGDL